MNGQRARADTAFGPGTRYGNQGSKMHPLRSILTVLHAEPEVYKTIMETTGCTAPKPLVISDILLERIPSSEALCYMPVAPAQPPTTPSASAGAGDAAASSPAGTPAPAAAATHTPAPATAAATATAVPATPATAVEGPTPAAPAASPATNMKEGKGKYGTTRRKKERDARWVKGLLGGGGAWVEWLGFDCLGCWGDACTGWCIWVEMGLGL